jgi:hypothetical protein
MQRRSLKVKGIALFAAVLMLMVSTPCQSLLAAMVSTEELLDLEKIHDAREVVNQALAREDVKQALMAQGVDPSEAQARINALSNAEIMQLAEKIENLPAGKGPIGVIVGAAVLVFLVLLVTDILGYTKVFPFVKPHNK